MYLEMGGMYNIKSQNVFGRKIYINQCDIGSIRKKFNNTDVYKTVFYYDNDNQDDSNLYGSMYLDLDMDFTNDSDYKKLKEDLSRIVTYINLQYGIPTNYIKFYFTGKKGFHMIIPPKVFGIVPDKNLNVYFKAMALELSKNTIYPVIDLRIYDKKRLLRLPNSINGKTGLYKVPITFEDIKNFSYQELIDYASSSKKMIYEEVQAVDKAIAKYNQIKKMIDDINNKKIEKKFVIPTNVDIDKITFPECIKTIFNNGCSSGNRNNTTVVLASSILQKGIDYETTLSIIKKWNHEKNDPSLNDREVETTVFSAYQLIQSGKRYGCATIKDLGLCVSNKCKIFK